MSEHTKEPWAIQRDDRKGMEWNNHVVSADDPNIAICFMAHDNTYTNVTGEANVRRIVACVNACAGIDTEKLEQKHPDSYIAPKLASAMLKTKERQVNELLTALNTLYDHAEGFNVSGVYFNEFMENKAALNTALEAIAKAEEF